MQTWFNRDRGLRSGRLKPKIVTPADGENVFVLGAEGLTEKAILADGDYVEVSQRVDLTGFDVVAATMDTLGTLMGVSQSLAGFPIHPSTFLWFDFDVGAPTVSNKVEGGFPFVSDGSIEVGTETYSPNGTFCRTIPDGVGVARMLGANTPQAFPATMDDYTFQFWLNFDSSVFASSTGVNSVVFEAMSANGGLRVSLLGVGASHEWYFLVEHNSGGALQARAIDGFFIDVPLGWKLFTLRYRDAQSFPDQCQLFMDTALVGAASSDFGFGSTEPDAGEDVLYGSANLVGGLDAIRLLDVALSDSQIAVTHAACIVNPPLVEYNWIMQILLDGTLYGERVIAPDEQRTWTDFKVPCRLVSVEADVAFRLKLEQLP